MKLLVLEDEDRLEIRLVVARRSKPLTLVVQLLVLILVATVILGWVAVPGASEFFALLAKLLAAKG